DGLPPQVANPDSILVQVQVARWIHRPQHPVVRSDVRAVQGTVDVNLDLTVVRISRYRDMSKCVQRDKGERCRVESGALDGVAELNTQPTVGEKGNTPVINNAAHFC